MLSLSLALILGGWKGGGWEPTQKKAELGKQMEGKRVEKIRQEEKAQQATGDGSDATPMLQIIGAPVATTMSSVFVRT